jgi:hypothetical protein
VRRDLPDSAWTSPGRFLGPDGRTYSRLTTRLDRSEVEALVEGGCPVLTYLPGGRLVWHDEDDAWPAWADARAALTTGLPEGEAVTGSRWEAVDGGTVVVLVRH